MREVLAIMAWFVVGVCLWGGLASGELQSAIRAVRAALGI